MSGRIVRRAAVGFIAAVTVLAVAAPAHAGHPGVL